MFFLFLKRVRIISSRKVRHLLTLNQNDKKHAIFSYFGQCYINQDVASFVRIYVRFISINSFLLTKSETYRYDAFLSFRKENRNVIFFMTDGLLRSDIRNNKIQRAYSWVAINDKLNTFREEKLKRNASSQRFEMSIFGEKKK